MASLSYTGIGKWIEIDWSEFYNFYGRDFNPNVPTLPTNWTTASAYDETSTFYLSWFSVWNEVWCYVFNIDTWGVAGSWYVESEFQVYRWWWATTWDYSWNFSTSSPKWMWYMYFWIDDDEIWDDATNYRILTNREYEWEWENWIITTFSVSGLSFDSTLHNSWYLWIQWNHLCYTDWTRWNRGYKHIINYDSWYDGWTWEPWYIWLPSSANGKIYYTDAYGNVRRTHSSYSRYGWSSYPSSAVPWKMRIPTGWMEDWYWYLCFVDGDGELRRLWNGEP